MPSSFPGSIPEDQYVDLTDRFLTDTDSRRLRRDHPNLRECPTCGGVGEYQWKGETVECDCRSQIQLHKHYLQANIGLMYQRLDWGDYTGDPEALQVIVTWLTHHQRMIRAGVGVILFGTFGTGKSMLASLAAKELVKLGYRPFFSTFAGAIDLFTKGWGDQEEKANFERRILQSDVFFLDDLGKEFKTKNNLAESTFDHILRERVIAGRPTFITTNLTEAEMGVGYGSAVLSLLRETSIQHEMSGDDWRASAQERKISEAVRDDVRKVV